MKFDRSIALPLFVALAVLYAFNFHCWQPGIGGRTDRDADGARPEGSELEIYLGFPAVYRAELWRSDDPNLTTQLLQTAPYISPRDPMRVAARYASRSAAVVDGLFALSALVLVILAYSAKTHQWNQSAIIVVLVAAATAIACFLAAGNVSAHL